MNTTFTGSMDWMYEHKNIYLWAGCMKTKTRRGPMDWMYEHKNIYRLYGLDV
jgi:hypothetical protein